MNNFRLITFLTVILSVYSVNSHAAGLPAMIKRLAPETTLSKAKKISKTIKKAATTNGVKAELFVVILDIESGFKDWPVNATGDISIAQVNYRIWNKEFKRLKLPKLDKTRLKKDHVYAINILGSILKILKKRYEHKDKMWYARYHSKTKKLKIKYNKMIQRRLLLVKN